MLKRLVFITFLSVLFINSAYAYDIEAKVENSQISLGEVFDLELIYNGNDINNEQPDLDNLREDFRIYSTSNSMQSSYINGVGQFKRIWTIGLMPKKEGEIKIPSLKIGNLSSNPIEIKVLPQGSVIERNISEKSQNESEESKAINNKFSAYLISDNQNPYVKQQINVTLIIKDNVGLQINSDPVWENADNWKIKQIKAPTIDNDGKGHRTIKFYYAMFADQAGMQSLPDAHIDAYYVTFDETSSSAAGGMWGFLDMGFNSMFGKQKPVLLTTKSKQITVREVPQNYGNGNWIPAEKLALQADWSDANPVFKVGETVSREIVLVAQGVDQESFPEFEFKENSQMKQYPESPRFSVLVNNDKVISQSITRIVYIPQKSGEYTFPEIKLKWFNVNTEQVEISSIPAQKIYIEKSGLNKEINSLNNSESVSNNELSKNSKLSNLSKNIVNKSIDFMDIFFTILAAFIAGILFCYLLLTKKFNKGNNAYINDIIKRIEDDVKNNDIRSLQNHIIAWGNAFYKDSEIHNINDVSRNLDNDDFSKQMDILNNILYGKSNESINGNLILQIIKGTKGKQKHKAKNKPLPDLYK